MFIQGFVRNVLSAGPILIVSMVAHAQSSERYNPVIADDRQVSLSINRDQQTLRPPMPIPDHPTAIPALYYDKNTDSYQPVRMHSDYAIRTEPKAGSARVAMVRDSYDANDLVLTGDQIIENVNGKQNVWIQVLYKQEIAWIHGDAVLDRAKKMNTIAETSAGFNQEPPRPPAPILAPGQVGKSPSVQPKKVAAGKPPRPPMPIPPPAGKKAAQPPASKLTGYSKPTGPMCVSSKKDMLKSPVFVRALHGTDPYTVWVGPPESWGATFEVFGDGTGVLNHPMKGKIPLTVSLCLDRNKKVYANINGGIVYLEGPELNQATVRDPSSPKDQYTFTRGVR